MHNTHTCVAAVVMETPPCVMRRNVKSKFYSYFKIFLSSKYCNTRLDCACLHFTQYLLTATYTAYGCKDVYQNFMDLFLDSCKYRLCQIDKTVKIFENVAFSGRHFLKVYIYCKLETYLFLKLSLLVIVYASLFIISLNIGQKTRY